MLQGPGCLNFTLILRIRKPGPLENIGSTNRFILDRHRQALAQLLGRAVSIQGSTDLTLDGLKFSGNSQRRKTQWLLFHGTFLLSLDLPLMETLLPLPSRQPAYRADRSHRKFLTQLSVHPTRLKEALKQAWDAHRPAGAAPKMEINRLMKDRYSQPDWNLRTILP